MSKENKSFLLGQFVFLVQAMEESLVSSPDKGENWGEQVLLLFKANLESTLQMMEKIISNFPESVAISSERIVSRGDLHKLVTKIDFSTMNSQDVLEEAFLQGYQNPFGMKEEEEEKTSQSYYLGVFMGTLFCFEKAISPLPLEDGRNHGEDSFLLVNINFNTAMQMAEKTISTLPPTAELNGKGITLEDLQRAYRPLDKKSLANTVLEQEDFVFGFDQVLHLYWDVTFE
ncbi:MAG: hypothetical protein R3Y63_10020 [Eubacteriales bacterium]